jgi:hypothetical protein
VRWALKEKNCPLQQKQKQQDCVDGQQTYHNPLPPAPFMHQTVSHARHLIGPGTVPYSTEYKVVSLFLGQLLETKFFTNKESSSYLLCVILYPKTHGERVSLFNIPPTHRLTFHLSCARRRFNVWATLASSVSARMSAKKRRCSFQHFGKRPDRAPEQTGLM